MKAFLTDLLHDLKEKKLWPVAALLLLAVVAAPAVLLKSGGDSAEDVAAVPPAQAGPGMPEAAVVSLAAEEPGEASDLERFDAKNPFGDGGEPPSKAEPAPAGESEGESDTPASGDSPGGSAPSSGDSPSSGGGDGGSGDGDAGDTPARPVAYTYQVDVRFGRRDGRIRSYRGLERFDVLPRTGEVPVLIFLGVSPTAKTAIFLVDSSVTQEGDGRCKPTKEECTYLQLTTAPGHDLHYLTTESGAPYAIRLTDIRRVRVGTSARSSRSSRRARSSARRGSPPAVGADLVVEGR